MPVPIAELFIAVSADVSGAINGLNQVNGQLGRTTNAFQQARPAALAFTAAGSAIGVGLAGAIKVGADFNKEIAGVRANMSPAEVNQFGGAVRQLALDLGEDTSFSAREAAAGIEELLKAGIPAEAILGGAAKAALDLAAATGSTVADAGAIAASAMNAFGLSVTDLPEIVNTLTGVTVTTAADMNDLKLGISDVASVAAGFGLTMTDTAVSLGIFRDAGLTGNTAGTALKTMLVGLIPNTEKENKLFRQLGLITADGANQFFDATGNIKDMASIAGVLQNALRGMTAEQRQATLVQLFGTQGFQAANILYEQGAAGVRRYTAEVKKIDAATVAAERLNSLTGDVEKLTGAIEKTQVIISDVFDPVLRRLTQRATEVVKAFNALPPNLQRAVVLFTAIAGGVLFLLGSLVLLAPFIAAAIIAFPAMGVALATLAPILAVAGLAVAALVEAWRRDLGGIQGIVLRAFVGLPELFEQVAQHVEQLRDIFSAELTANMQRVSDFVDTELNPALAIARDRFDELHRRVEPLVVPLGLVATSVQDLSISFLSAGSLIGGVVTVFDRVRDFFANFGFDLSNAQVGFLGLRAGLLLLGPILGVVGGPIGVVAGVVAVLAGALLFAYQNNEAFRTSVDGLLAGLAPLGGAIQAAYQPLVDFVTTNAPAVLAFFDRLGTALSAELLAQGESLQPFLDSVGRLFGSLGAFMTAIGNVGGEVLQRIFGETLGPAIQNMRTALEPLLPFLQQFLDIMGPLPTLGQQLAPVTKIFNDLATALDAITLALQNAVVPDWLVQMMGQAILPPGLRQFAPGAGAVPGATAQGVGFTPGGGSGPLVSIGQMIIGSEVDADNFLARMAELLAGSADRVNPPPDNTGNPTLSPVFS